MARSELDTGVTRLAAPTDAATRETLEDCTLRVVLPVQQVTAWPAGAPAPGR